MFLFFYYMSYLSFEIGSIVLISFACLVSNCSDSWFVCRMLARTMHMLASDGLSYAIGLQLCSLRTAGSKFQRDGV